ncbi:hypothetical protein C8Q75DRAFT_774720 [Abortiporus biennis]|nr:hypothetical protein C8Q75DRAFT_774720 [Abortiporus biennis]
MLETISKTATSISTPTKTGNGSNHRLLYRGALSLPDSHMLLDGLSFTANALDATSSPSSNLLDNQLALSLESMRGRPNLHFLGTENLDDVWLDTKTVNVYIHPYSVLSQMYFENILCLAPITSPDKRTQQGIRVGLSDSTEATDFLIYGQLMRDTESTLIGDTPSSSLSPPQTLHILAARILPNPPRRPPRPDDPTPRKPPARLMFSSSASSKRKRDASVSSLDALQRSKSFKKEEEQQILLARDVMLHGPRGSSLARTNSAKLKNEDIDVFKVPSLPARSYSQFSIRDGSTTDADVIGGTADGQASGSKGKGKSVETNGSAELEKANKTVIKQAAVSCLGKHGIKKGEAEFNELYQSIYRGATFALRNIMRTQAVNIRVVERLLEAHAKMYVNGNGDNHTCNNTTDVRKG